MTNLVSSLSSSSNKLSGILKTLEENPVPIKANEKEKDKQEVEKDNASDKKDDVKENGRMYRSVFEKLQAKKTIYVI